MTKSPVEQAAEENEELLHWPKSIEPWKIPPQEVRCVSRDSFVLGAKWFLEQADAYCDETEPGFKQSVGLLQDADDLRTHLRKLFEEETRLTSER